MGIRGMETYLERQSLRQCQTVARPVIIKGLIKAYKQEKNSDSIKIVVDGDCCVPYFYGDLECCLGGQYKEFVTRLKNFALAFTSLGVTLVFYFDGATAKRKRPTWIRRCSDAIKVVHEIFDAIEEDRMSESTELMCPSGIGSVAHSVFKHVCNCEVRISVIDADEEIAAFARENECFAILGQDTDFVILEGAKYYLSMKNLDLKNMKTIFYDRSAFAQMLQIPTWHLPLLATLCGNDIIPNTVLKEFHDRECYQPSYQGNRQRQFLPFGVVVKGVSSYICSKRLGKELSAQELSSIAWDVFRDASSAALIETSVKSYDPSIEMPAIEDTIANLSTSSDSNWNAILRVARERHMTGGVSQIYPIMMGGACEWCAGLEDFRKKDLPPALQLLQPLRQRFYGILLAEKEGVVEVEEWCVRGENEEEWNVMVPLIAPREGLHPGLLALWTGDENFLDQRWELFVSSIAPQLSAATLRKLPQHLVVPAAILSFLRNNIPAQGTQCLLDLEIDAMVIQAVLLSTTDPSTFNVGHPFNTRAMRIASVFMQAVAHVTILLAACGFPLAFQDASPHLYFDGKLFQKVYKCLVQDKPVPVQQLCTNQDGVSFYSEYLQLRAAI